MSKTVIAIASTTVSLPKNGSADDLKAGRIPIDRRDHQTRREFDRFRIGRMTGGTWRTEDGRGHLLPGAFSRSSAYAVFLWLQLNFPLPT
jgi:hypothetical protein